MNKPKPNTHHRKLRRASAPSSTVQRVWQRVEALREPPAPTALVEAQLQAAFDALLTLAPNLQEPLVGSKDRARLLGGLFPQASGLVGRVVDALRRTPARYPDFVDRADSLAERQHLAERLQFFGLLCEHLAQRARGMANLLQAQALSDSLVIIDEVQQRAAEVPPRSPGSLLHAARAADMAMAARLLWQYKDEVTRRWRERRAQNIDGAPQPQRPPGSGSDNDVRELLAELAAGFAQR